MKTSIINWISCQDRLPDYYEGTFLVVVKERWNETEDWQYDIDIAKPYGDYIDDFWDTQNDWNEGQEVHITHWVDIDNIKFKEEKNG